MKITMQNHLKKRLLVWAVVMWLILSIFLVSLFSNFGHAEIQLGEVVAYSIIFLSAGGFYELWQWLKTRIRLYRLAFGLGLAGLLLLGWVSGAVGIIGSENNTVNLMYWGVPAVMLIGSLASRFRPHGMAYALFATAALQFLVPVLALIISPEVSWGNAGVIGVFIVNSIFTVLFVGSALLFQRAAVASKK